MHRWAHDWQMLWHKIGEIFYYNRLTHYPLVTPYDDKYISKKWLRKWHVACRHQAFNCTKVDSMLYASIAVQCHSKGGRYSCKIHHLISIFKDLLLHLLGENELIEVIQGSIPLTSYTRACKSTYTLKSHNKHTMYTHKTHSSWLRQCNISTDPPIW